MFAHLFKPIWKRKASNLMLSLEIGLCFVVVFAIAAAACRFWQLYHQPVGFEPASVWTVDIQVSNASGIKNDKTTYDRFKRALQALPEVDSVAFAAYSPYENDTWQTDWYLPGTGASIPGNVMQVSDDFFETLHMPLSRGRAFSSVDEGAAGQPVVINERFARAMFPGQDPVGKVFSDGKPGSKDSKLMKVVGVTPEFRSQGEFMTPVAFVITRFSPQSDTEGLGTILLRVKPGTSRAFEARLSQQLKLVRNDWSYQIATMEDLRASMHKQVEIPLVVFAVIASFLLLMVGFGLFGVLWQSTTKRIPEIGLRRATGATAAGIYRQIVIEQLLLTSLAMAVGLVLLVQLPITGVFGDYLTWGLFGIAALVSAAVMVLVSVLCSLYPAWRASRLSPTQALQYE